MSANAKRFAIRSTLEVEMGREGASPLFWNFTAWRGALPEVLLTQKGAEQELARLQSNLPHNHTLAIFDVATYRDGCKVMAAVRESLRAIRLPNYAEMPREVRMSEEVRAVCREINVKARAAAEAAGYSFF